MTYKKIAFPICIASAVLMLSACGGGSSGTSTTGITGAFEDGLVYNLPYTCSPSDLSGTTNQNGEFTCNEGDAVSFHVGSTTLGPIAAKADELVTPYKLFPNDTDQAIRLSQLLLSLDDDGDYSEIITFTPEYLALITEEIDFSSATFEDDVQAMLDDANLTLVDAQTAEDHLHAADTELPIITLLGEPEVIIEVGNAYMDPGATAYDEFEGRLDPVRTGTVDTDATGIYMYTYSATDSAGNTGTATRQIVVLDTIAPEITLNGDSTVTISVGDSYTDAGATAMDNVDGVLTPVMSGSVNTAVAGTYTITWTATDALGNVGTVNRTVIVQDATQDTVPPVVTLNGDNPMYLFEGTPFTDPGATATDDVDGSVNVTVSGTVDANKAGTYTLTYSATDAAGNVGRASRTVNVVACQNYNPMTGACEDELPGEDTVAPVITLNGENPMYLFEGTLFTDPGATATDDVDGSVNVTVSGTVDANKAGTYTLTYSATDAAGNVGRASRTVNVVACQNYNPMTGACEDELPGEDTVAPVVTLNGDATVNIDGNTTYEDAGATAIDDVDDGLTPTMSGNVDTAVADTYSIVWSATDNAGNTGTATRTIVVGPEQTGCQAYNPLTGLCED